MYNLRNPDKSLISKDTVRGEPKGQPSYCTISYIDITDEEFELIANYIRTNYGINLRKEKKALVISRLGKILVKKGCTSFSEYFDLVRSDKTGNEAATLINAITTNHTYFMREKAHFEYFRY